jgi:hypothetical protein
MRPKTIEFDVLFRKGMKRTVTVRLLPDGSSSDVAAIQDDKSAADLRPGDWFAVDAQRLKVVASKVLEWHEGA